MRPIFGNGEAIAPMPQAPMDCACSASLRLALAQHEPTWTMTLKPAGAAFIHASASAMRSSSVSM